jgi:hypothetical protein
MSEPIKNQGARLYHAAALFGRTPGSESGSVTSGGEPPDNGSMELRIAKLESLAERTGDRLAVIEKDLAVIRSNHATKEDVAALRGDMKASVAEAKNSIIMWVVSAILLAQLLPPLLKRFGF